MNNLLDECESENKEDDQKIDSLQKIEARIGQLEGMRGNMVSELNCQFLVRPLLLINSMR